MFYYLHNYTPPSILWSAGSVTIYYYGLIMVVAMVAGIILALRVVRLFKINAETILDLSFYLIIGGLVGARLYHVGLEWAYYAKNYWEIVMVWQGGLAIHGGVLGGLIVILVFARLKKINFWYLTGAVAPALLLGQMIGRWGNYFNQELFGRPTELPWGILIELGKRPSEYLQYSHFHPTFLYESLASFVALIIILLLIKKWQAMVNNGTMKLERMAKLILSAYLISFGVYRFLVELIKIDETPVLLALRWPQLVSLLLIVLGIIIIFENKLFREYVDNK